MEEDKALDMDIKKPEVANNELKVDLKTPVPSAVVPVAPSEEKKTEEEPVVVDTSITNNEVCLVVLFHVHSSQ